MLSAEYDFVFKILLIGDSAVGKSSLLLRFADNSFQDTFLPTIGVDFRIRTIQQAGSLIKLQMWDTAGQDKFRVITSGYYKGAHGIILAYDITNRKSFENLQMWLEETEKKSSPQVIKILVGNKADLQGARTVSRQEAESFAESTGMQYIEASAKTDLNVEWIFTELSKVIKQKFGVVVSSRRASYTQPIRRIEDVNKKNSVRTCC